MKTHNVTGGKGVQLHVVEAGNPSGRPILFIPGNSQCWLAWNRQMNSDLAAGHRLVAMDWRGHGLSEKPRDGYADSKLCADDLNAVIQTLKLDHPVLCGWSYGPIWILDYVRHYGEEAIGGMISVGGVTKLGSDDANSVIDPRFFSLVPGFFSTDVEESTSSLRSLLRFCFAQPLPADELFLMLGYNVSVPPYVRQGNLTRLVDNDDLLPRLRKPFLIVQGALDAIVKRSAVDQIRAKVPHAQVEMMANVGHAPFWEDATVFNQKLRAFVEQCSTASASKPVVA